MFKLDKRHMTKSGKPRVYVRLESKTPLDAPWKDPEKSAKANLHRADDEIAALLAIVDANRVEIEELKEQSATRSARYLVSHGYHVAAHLATKQELAKMTKWYSDVKNLVVYKDLLLENAENNIAKLQDMLNRGKMSVSEKDALVDRLVSISRVYYGRTTLDQRIKNEIDLL